MNGLQAGTIRERIRAALCPHLESLEVFAEIDSTNSYLLSQAPPPAGRFRVALAEYQTAGRGQQGRRWVSPPSTGICLSVSYTFRRQAEQLSCLALAVGVGLAELMEGIGIRGIGLKWPNDLVMRNAKLGGILTELRSGSVQSNTVVVGLGLNVDLAGAVPGTLPASKFGPVIDLASCCDRLPPRNDLSALLIGRLFDTLAEFDADGFTRFHAAWPAYDWLRGQRVCVEVPGNVETGTCQGIDTDGALMLLTARGRMRIRSGSVQLNGLAGCKAS